MNTSRLCLLSTVAIVAMTSPLFAQTPPPDGGTPAGRYTYAPAGATVTDTRTGLIWQRTNTLSMSQSNAKSYCANTVPMSLGGTGWRVPTVKELLTLIDYSQSPPPLIDHNGFPGAPSIAFWSSSLVTALPSSAYFVDFQYGYTGTLPIVSSIFVRCVR